MANTIADFDIMAGVSTECVEQIAQCPWEAGRHLASMLAGKRFSTGDRLIVSLADGRVAGFAVLAAHGANPTDTRGPWVSFVYCWPEHRGQGLAAAMVGRACELAAGSGAEEAFVSSALDSIGLYQALGFHEIERAATPWGEEVAVCSKRLV